MTQPLPVPRPAETAGQRQPMPGWPVEPAIDQHAVIEMARERGIAYLPDPYNPSRSVAVYRDLVERPAPQQPRDLTPLPLIDPIAARLLAGGVGGGALGAGVGWGFGQAAAGIAAFGGSSAVLVVALLLAAAKLPSVGRGGGTHIEKHVHHHNSWWGKSTTSL